ncbi:MAG: FAD-dependent oxidoreductase [Actinomycetota bacterium]|nr:FAD-dependent oxidoreductase [Actinomycetota bacterium]
MSAASTAKRLLGDDLDVVVLERGRWTSYSACGIPYWVAGDVACAEALVARSPQEHRERGIDVRIRTEVTDIDLDAGRVEVRGPRGGTSRIPYDVLMLGTGAVPIRPDLPGADAEGIFGVQTLEHGAAILATLGTHDPRRVVVVGGGYIGVEMAEACVRRGLDVTLVDQAEQPMGRLDPELGDRIAAAMEGMGIDVRTGVEVTGFDCSAGRVRAVATADGVIETDLVVLGIGVRPEVRLASAAGLRLGRVGGLRTDPSMRCDGRDEVYAAGDCVETWDRIREDWAYVPLGTHANKQGRVAGLGIAGRRARFPGVVGTAVTKVCNLEIARTGLTEKDAAAAGIDAVAATIETTTTAGYWPTSQPMTLKMVARRSDRRMLGAQIIGHGGAAIRIDTCAMALWTRMTVDELVFTDLAYAPPFSSVWDPVQVAARAVVSALE